MSRPVRTKRNFKALQLNVTSPPPPPPSEPEPLPIPIRLAGKAAPGGGKKRPPPMNLKPKVAADTPPPSDSSSAVDGFVALAPAPSSAPVTGTPSAGAKRMTYHTALSNTLASLDLNAEVNDLRDEDLKDLHELGQGNGGSVKKVEHVPSRTIMAKKVCLPPARVALPGRPPSPSPLWCAYRVPADRPY